MDIGDEIGRLRTLSDAELMAGLSGALGSSRRWTALVLAHLAEVEGRRLHLLAGSESLFSYCTVRLGMSEDEACRRIEVARLARRFPVLYEMLGSGIVSLSVAALLKHHLSEGNHVGLLSAVSRKTVRQVREVLAAWFPQADVPPSIRKLPERGRATGSDGIESRTGDLELDASCVSSSRETVGTSTRMAPHGAMGVIEGRVAASAPSAEPSTLPSPPPASSPPALPPRPQSGAASSVRPLSPGRYKIAFTADAELKRKLELASDLLRHAVPDGDLATLVSRALDLLLDETLRRRFAKTSSAKGVAPATSRPTPPPARPDAPDTPDAINGSNEPAAPEPTPHQSSHIPSAVRRTVLDRDGLRCTWRSSDGTRCDSRAWLERDHVTPRGQGGGNDAANLRHFCRAHNRLAAEQAYGQTTITRIIARRRAKRSARADTANPSSNGGA